MTLTPLQQLLILGGLAALALGVALVLAGLHVLCHRVPPLPEAIYHRPSRPPAHGGDQADDDTAEMAPVRGEAPTPRPARGRWT